MRIEFIEVPDDLASEVDRLWPDTTWSEVMAYALSVVVNHAYLDAAEAHNESANELEASA